VAYRFLHDRVHQAAYTMMDDAERTRVHAALGRNMMRSLGDGAHDGTLFDVLGHLMAGASRIDDPSDRLQVARCALLAGRRARASLAYDAAVSFVRFGIGFLPERPWSSEYRLTADLHLEALHCEYLAGHSDRADALFATILGSAATNVEEAEAYRARIVLLENASQFAAALRCGADCLRLFGVELDLEPGDASVVALVGEVKALVGAREVASLRDAPEATDKETLALAQTLLALTAPAYFLGPRLFASLIAHMVLLALRRGNTPFSAAGYVFFGVVLASFGDHQTGYDFGRLALDLIEKLPNPAIRGKVEFMFGNWLNFRRDHARTDIDHLIVAFQSCVAAGDRTYATYCCIGLVQLWFAIGRNVAEAHADVPKWMGFVEQVKALDIADNIRTVDRALMCLAGLTHGPHTYDDDGFVEADFERHLNEVRSPPVQAYFYHHRSFVRFIHEDFAGALADTRESEERHAATSGQFIAEEHPFHQSLILAAVHADVSDAERTRHSALLDRNLARLRAIAAQAPVNFAHKVALVEAERARLEGDTAAATELYDRAVDLAERNGYAHHAAIANECAARFYLARHRTTLARAYLTEAYHGFAAWGALAKVRQLAEKHRRLISDLVVDAVRASGMSGLTTTGTTLGGTYALDVLSVAKASQAISREIQLDRLLEQLVRILLENAGAERGFLLLRRGRPGEWVIEAAGDAKGVQVLRSIPIDGGVLPQTMVHYVARTGEPVVLDDASLHDEYGRDPYIARHRVKSAACLPAVNTGNLVAIVYLENNLSAAAFSLDRLEVLRFLSTQIAISIDNATLYAGLEEKVRDRTAALERAQAHLRLLERLETERQIAGGFAHELRNSLAGPTALMAEMLGLNDRHPPASIPLANAKRLEDVLTLFGPTATGEQIVQLKSILRDVFAGEERLESMLQVAHGSVSRALWITQEILDYARVGNERAAPVLVDVNATVRTLARELDLELGRERVRLEARLDPALGPVRAHEAQIHSVIKNLVLNARDATLAAPAAAGGDRVILVTTEASVEQARIAVVDRGIGIAPEDLGRVFEPFFSTKPESGTGLGLAVAKKIVSLAGGRLTVESTPGEGTRFDVVFPAANPTPKQ
jgi:histidine kinase